MATSTNDRFGKLIERQDGVDFPFYNGKPVDVATWKWIVIILSTVAGFLALTLIPRSNNFDVFIPRTLFLAIPLVTLALMAGKYWKSIFRKVGAKDVGLMFFFMLLNFAITFATAPIIKALFGANPNDAFGSTTQGGVAGTIAFYASTGIQLIGEEVFTILPFLAIMYFLYRKFNFSRKKAIILSWFLSALWFGAAHFPTYDWNILQALLIIGGARIAFTLAYIRTKNLWVSSGAHVLFDWISFTLFTLV